ncbi:hypothetical protein CDAR_433861 [Caerostris darwini]|uniref:Caspase-8 n=1 Tax=Caerostris darwini TaxID=1538125 RepID=A0AAV4QWX7_9ARAC|nr:hypothetical protein CDAR_433861 [Caerostris darwini]
MDKHHREIIQNHKDILSEIPLDEILSLAEDFKIFTNAMLEDIKQDKTIFYDELCTRGPFAFGLFLHILKITQCGDLAAILEKESTLKKLSPFYYGVNSVNKGLCLIIINEIFDDKKKNRKGSKVDASRLKYLFESLHFDVETEWNKETEQIESILKEFAVNPRLRNVDSCIVYILTHGDRFNNRDYIIGTNEVKLFVDEIYTMFNNQNCPLLKGKPKMFFIQACRGPKEDYGVKTDNSKPQKEELESASLSSTDAVGFLNAEISENILYPTMSDMVIVHSTLPSYKSRKNHDTGSWLCDDLVNVISNHYKNYDLLTMLTFVCSRMQDRVSVDQTKQTIHVETFGLTGLIHFNRKASKLKDI